MKISETGIEGLLLIEPRVFKDERGYFFESYSQKYFEQAGVQAEFVQDNQSLSQKGILRGMHFQSPPAAQGKLVRVITGSVLDIVVDIRKGSPTYGKSYSVELNADNFLQLWIPEGFAHGFLTLQDNTIFSYKCTAYYSKETEGGLMWNDPDLKLDWGDISKPLISEKDMLHPRFINFDSPFTYGQK